MDPQLAHAVADLDEIEWRAQIEAAATILRNYQAGRWAIAQIRESLPRAGRLMTRPQGIDVEFELPADLGEGATWNWLNTTTTEFRSEVFNQISEARVRESFDDYRGKLPVSPAEDVLLWYSGKDLLASIQHHLAANGFSQPSDFVQRVILWTQENPGKLRDFFPEWQALKDILNA